MANYRSPAIGILPLRPQPQSSSRDEQRPRYSRRPPRSSSYVPPHAPGDYWRPSYDRAHHSRHEHSPDDQRSPHPHDRSQARSAPHNEPLERSVRSTDRATPAPALESSRLLPKHFAKPLTCFYWATQGHCSKSDDECWYAHSWTGVVAAAPVRVGDGGAVAGREAERAVNQMSEREAILKSRQDTIVERERQLARDQQILAQDSSTMKNMMHEIYGALATVEDSNVDATRALERRRTELLINELSGLDDNFNPLQAIHGAVTAVDGALDALAVLKVKISAIAHQFKNNVGIFDRGDNTTGDSQTFAGTEEEDGGVGFENNPL